MPPITIPPIARPRPVGCGTFFIWESATKPSITAMIPGIGTAQSNPTITLKIPTTNDATANPGGEALTFGVGGGGGGSHERAAGPRLKGSDSLGAIQPPPGGGGSRGSHCVVCSDGSSNRVSRIRGSQFGSADGVRSSRRRLPSSVQKVSQTSEYCLLHCGQYFIEINGLDQFEAAEEVRDLDRGVLV